jgi:hypothetical protein
MKEEYKRLFDLFSMSREGKEVDLNEVLRESLVFFDQIKETFKDGTEEDKKEMMKVMNEMYQKLMSETKFLAEKSGMSEEELYHYTENPNNFDPEQWKTMQETKKKMFESGRQISSYMKGKKPPENAPTYGSKAVRAKKDKWTRA